MDASTALAAPSTSRAMRWTGYVLSALPVAMLAMSAAMKLSHAPAMLEKWTPVYGYPEGVLTPIAVVELLCAAIYAVPRTAVLGAILVTGYLGGAVATHVRASEPFFVPLLLGVLAWGGLFLRDRRVRDLMLSRG